MSIHALWEIQTHVVDIQFTEMLSETKLYNLLERLRKKKFNLSIFWSPQLYQILLVEKQHDIVLTIKEKTGIQFIEMSTELIINLHNC